MSSSKKVIEISGFNKRNDNISQSKQPYDTYLKLLLPYSHLIFLYICFIASNLLSGKKSLNVHSLDYFNYIALSLILVKVTSRFEQIDSSPAV